MKSLLLLSSACLCSLALTGCGSLSALQEELQGAELNLDASTYVVRPGETLDTIAFRYRMSAQDLKTLNPGLEIVPGAYLKLRAASDSQLAVSTASNPQGDSTPDNRSDVGTEPVVIPQAVVIADVLPDVTADNPHSDEALLKGVSSDSQPRDKNTSLFDVQTDYPDEEIIEEETFGMVDGLANGLVQGIDALSDRFLSSTDDTSVNAGTTQVAPPTNRWNGDWQWPTNGPVAREYDARKPNGRGIDIAGAPGQDVYAANDGVVTFSGRDPSGIGKLVIVRHENDYLSIYSHTRDLFVSEHDTVSAGDPIASLGANANDEAMLRFELRKDGKLLNPINYLPPL